MLNVTFSLIVSSENRAIALPVVFLSNYLQTSYKRKIFLHLSLPQVYNSKEVEAAIPKNLELLVPMFFKGRLTLQVLN